MKRIAIIVAMQSEFNLVSNILEHAEPREIEGAKALLDAAGIVDTDGDGWREYNGEKITIVFNMDTFEQTVTLDKNTLGYTELVGELYASGGEFSFTESGELVMPPQSIAIFK